MNINIALLLDKQSDLYSDRSALHLFTKSKPLDDPVHPRAVRVSADSECNAIVIGRA